MKKNLPFRMHLIGLLLFFTGCCSVVMAQTKKATLKDILTQIGAVYNAKFVYDDDLFDNQEPVNFKIPVNKSQNLEEVLKTLLYPKGYIFLYVDANHYAIVKDTRNQKRKLEITIEQGTQSTMRSVAGIITDSENKAVEGVTVTGVGTKLATFTNSDGRYALSLPINVSQLSLTYIGGKSKLIDISPNGLTNTFIESDNTMLDGVTIVSTGYQELPKERATGAFSIVSKKQIEQTPTPNILQRLENQVPGLQLNYLSGNNTIAYPLSNSADPASRNSVYTLNIRGVSTYRGNNYPLVVIDGFPAEVDLRALNPNDIEQITVLKDAAAASIWGARATNGVIVIETKKGKRNQRPNINFNSNFGISKRPDLNQQHLLTASQMLNFEQELVSKNLISDNTTADYAPGASQGVNLLFQRKRGNITQQQFDTQFAALGATTNYDQYGKYFLQTPTTQNYNLSVSGGGESYTYFTSASYAKELPIEKGNPTSRFTLTANQSFKITKNIDFSSSLKFSHFNSAYRGLGLTPLTNRTFPFMPYDKVVDANGNGVDYFTSFNKTFTDKLLQMGYLSYAYNYLQEIQNADFTGKETNVTGNFNLSAVLPVKGLTANVLYSIEKSFGSNRNYQNPYTFAARDFMNFGTSYDPVSMTSTMNVPYGGILNINEINRDNYSLRGQLSYANQFNGKHELNVIAGSEIRQTYDITNGNGFYGWNDDSQITAFVPSAYMTLYGYQTTLYPANAFSDQKRRFLSYFSNAAYTFDRKYTLSGSVRYDDYNNFGLDVKYRAKPFWSSGLSWNAVKEDFLSDQKWLSALQIRTTYGISGNIDRNARPEATLSISGPDNLSGLPTATILAPANPNLQWESTKVFNTGLDASFFDNRLNVSFAYYIKNGSNLFAEFATDPTYGFTRLRQNSSTLKSKGFDGFISGDIIRTPKFVWNSVLNYAYNRNKVTDTRYIIPNSIVDNPAGAGLIAGYPTGYVMVYRFAGLDNTGQSLVYDQNNQVVNSATRLTNISDLKYAGNRDPKFFGSFNQNITYGNFMVNAQISYAFGYVFMRNTIPYYVNRGFINYNLNEDIDKRWRKPGDEASTNIPGVSGITSASYLRYVYSDKNILSADHIRLQQVSLGYNLKGSLLKELHVKSLNIQGVVRNLGIIWRKNKEGLDPLFPTGSVGSVIRIAPTPLYTLSVNANL